MEVTTTRKTKTFVYVGWGAASAAMSYALIGGLAGYTSLLPYLAAIAAATFTGCEVYLYLNRREMRWSALRVGQPRLLSHLLINFFAIVGSLTIATSVELPKNMGFAVVLTVGVLVFTAYGIGICTVMVNLERPKGRNNGA